VFEILADNNFGDTRGGGLAGPTGLAIILLLVIGTIFLIRSMNARLRRLPERFSQGMVERGEQPSAGPGAASQDGQPAGVAAPGTPPDESSS
jgi:hypothetical protein